MKWILADGPYTEMKCKQWKPLVHYNALNCNSNYLENDSITRI